MWNVHRKSLTFFGISTAIPSELLGFRQLDGWPYRTPLRTITMANPIEVPCQVFLWLEKKPMEPPNSSGWIYIYIIYIYIYNIHPILGWWWWALIPDFPSGQWSRLDGPDFFLRNSGDDVPPVRKSARWIENRSWWLRELCRHLFLSHLFIRKRTEVKYIKYGIV